MPHAFANISAHFHAPESLSISDSGSWSESKVLISISHDWKEHELKSEDGSEHGFMAPNDDGALIRTV